MQWPLNKILGDCTFETWLELDGPIVLIEFPFCVRMGEKGRISIAGYGFPRDARPHRAHLHLRQPFPGKARTLWALYNARPNRVRGGLLAVPHPERAVCREEWTDKAKCQISALSNAQVGRLWSLVLEIHTEMLTGHFLVID